MTTACSVLVLGMSMAPERVARAQANVHFDLGAKPSVVVVEGNQCTTPCSLLLGAGAHTVTIDGKAAGIKVPETKGSSRANFRSDVDLVDVVGGSAVAGIGLTVGIITLLVAAGAFYGTDDYGNPTGLAPICCGAEAILLIPSIVAILVGGVWLGLGVIHSGPRIVVSANRGPSFAPGGLGIRF
jgi:hypothetical protein